MAKRKSSKSTTPNIAHTQAVLTYMDLAEVDCMGSGLAGQNQMNALITSTDPMH